MLVPLLGALLVSVLIAASTAADQGLVLSLRLERPSYAPGKPIRVTLEVTNKSHETILVGFPTSQRFDLRLEDQTGKEIWRWSQGRVFLQMVGEETLQPDSVGLRYLATVPAPAMPGLYKFLARLTSPERQLRATISFQVR